MLISVDEESRRLPRGQKARGREAAGGVATQGDSEAQAKHAKWADLVARIRANDPSGMEELYRTFSRGIRYHLCKRVPPADLDDRVHDLFLTVVQAIQKDMIREPERLMGFVRTIVRRQVASSIGEEIQQRAEHAELEMGGRVADSRSDPEQQAILSSRQRFMLRVLKRIADRDREILIRYYLYEQTQDQICDEMRLTETQFRLMKSRAKSKLGEVGRRSLAQNILHALKVRRSDGY